MNKILPMMLLVFAGVLAYVVGQRMSAESMSIVVGVAFGVAASIPTSLLVIGIVRRSLPGAPPPLPPDMRAAPPAQPMIIVNPLGQTPRVEGQRGWPPPAQLEADEMPAALPATRRFRIIGADANLDD